MQIDLQFTQKDLYEAQRLHLAKSERYKFIKIICVIGLASTTVLLAGSQINPLLLVSYILILFLILIYPYTILKYTASSNFKQLQNMHHPLKLTIDSVGVSLHQQHYQGKTQWAGYLGYLYNDKIILLYLNSRTFTAIPKRALNSETWEKVLSLVKDNLKEK